jgi:hypothetical protein
MAAHLLQLVGKLRRVGDALGWSDASDVDVIDDPLYEDDPPAADQTYDAWG